jgi:hypothetical protein
LHGLENKSQEAESDSKPAASETNQESIAKEYDVAALLERLCNETKTEKEQATEELIVRLIEQLRVFSFNSPEVATKAKVPAPVIHASSAEPRLDDTPARIENGTLYAVGTAAFHTQLQEKIARYRENGFVQILAEIDVIRFPDGYNIGIEGLDISPEDRERGIVFIDSTLADRFIASVPDKGNKNYEIVSRPKVLFNNGTSFNVSTETDDIETIRKLQCVGKVALLESGKFDVEFELELSKQNRETEGDDENKNKLPSPITRVSVSTRAELATDKSLILRTPAGKQSAFGGHMIFVKVKCVVPSFERSKVTPAVSKNSRSHEDDTSIQIASATHETASKPTASHLPSIAIHALPISRYWQTPERYTFDYHFSPASTIADNLSRVADRQGSKDFKTLEAELRKVGYDAYIKGDVNFQLPASASDSNGVEISGKRLKVMMSQGSMLQCGFGRFTLSTVSASNTQDFDFTRFSYAEFDGNVLWTNRAGSIVAQSIKIDNNLVNLKGNVNIVDRQRFSATADRVLFDSETYSLGSWPTGKATLTMFDSSKEPQVVKADRIQFNLVTKEIQTDPAQ